MIRRPGVSSIVVFAVVLVIATLLLIGSTSPNSDPDTGQQIFLSSSGAALVGALDSEQPEDYLLANGSIYISAIDGKSSQAFGDQLAIDADIVVGERDYKLRVRKVMLKDPLGLHTTWGGVGAGESIALSGEGMPGAPRDDEAPLIAFGIGDLVCHGEVIATGIPVKIVQVDSGLPAGSRLALEIGDPKLCVLDGLPGNIKQMRVLWADYEQQPFALEVGASITEEAMGAVSSSRGSMGGSMVGM